MRKGRNLAPRRGWHHALTGSTIACLLFGAAPAWGQTETSPSAPATDAPADDGVAERPPEAAPEPAENAATTEKPAPPQEADTSDSPTEPEVSADASIDEKEEGEQPNAAAATEEPSPSTTAATETDSASPPAPSTAPQSPASQSTAQSQPSAPSAGDETGSEFSAYPDPAQDQAELSQQGDQRPFDIQPDRVFAEQWWTHTRPTMELHGNFRVRANLYHNFHLNRIDTPGSALWPRPLDDYYTALNDQPYGAQACTPDEAGTGSSDRPSDATVGCFSPTQGGADMRFRIEPAVIISDNLRVRSQIDMLGNLVMGSTASGYSNFPGGAGYGVSARSGYAPVSGLSNTQSSPVSGVNSLSDAITVRRAWAEYETPVGELKFGRMPDHWGLGMLYNAGDDLDGDYQSTADRIAFVTGLPAWSLYVGGAWDFQDEGPTSAAFTPPGGQAYDLSQRDDVSRMNLMMFRRMDPQLEQLALKKGKVVISGGLYLSYRWQRLANDYADGAAGCSDGAAALDCQPGEAASGIVRRGMKIWTPDVYGELKYAKFRAALEVVSHQGKFDSLATDQGSTVEDGGGWKVRQWAFAGEIEQKLIEDRLKLGFYFGWASGDGDEQSLTPNPDLAAAQIGDNKLETFRFHPGYRVDLILNRHILNRVQGSYYVKPMAQYDFIRKATGMRVGGRAEAIWTRASRFMQSPGHERDLGVELDASVYYQSTDGVLNKRDDLTGGFFGMLQYGVMFPLGGLGYQANQTADLGGVGKLKPAQMVRGFLGVAF